MTIDEFKRFRKGPSVRTIKRYCEDKLIPGAKINDSGQWNIPENAQLPFFIPSRVKLTTSKCVVYILKALNERKRLTSQSLHCSDREFSGLKNELIESKLIDVLPGKMTGDFFQDYKPTKSGRTIAEEHYIGNALVKLKKIIPEINIKLQLIGL